MLTRDLSKVGSPSELRTCSRINVCWPDLYICFNVCNCAIACLSKYVINFENEFLSINNNSSLIIKLEIYQASAIKLRNLFKRYDL